MDYAWEKVSEIIGTLEDTPRESRHARIAELCDGDPDLIKYIESIIAKSDEFPSVMSEKNVRGFTSFDLTTITGTNFRNSNEVVGQVLAGRFLIEANLTDSGSEAGGMGVVYLASDLNLLHSKVVVKVLCDAMLDDKNIVRKFLHEKEALIKLNHPGIVRILDAGTLADGVPYIVMEFIDGHSLRRILDSTEQLSLDFVAHVIESTAEALEAAHQQGIFHRDIKPENIMLSREDRGFDRVHLIDFGIARVTESQFSPVTNVKMLMGTPRYMAPEQILHSDEISAATDIYALAITAYEMLTGVRPFDSSNIAEHAILQKAGIKIGPCEIRPEIPKESERLILKGLAFQPDARPSSIYQFGKDFAESLRGLPKVESVSKNSLPRTAAIAGVIGTFLFGLLALYFILRPALAGSFLNSSIVATASNVPSTEERVDSPQNEISYSVGVRSIDKKTGTLAELVETKEDKIFQTGDRFSLKFSASEDGYMYVFSEGLDLDGNLSFSLLYPTPNENKGSSRMIGGQTLRTGANEITGKPGKEIVWLVWTKSRQSVLEDAKISAWSTTRGSVENRNHDLMLADFIDRQKKNIKSDTIKTETNKVVVKATGETILHKLELQHN